MKLDATISTKKMGLPSHALFKNRWRVSGQFLMTLGSLLVVIIAFLVSSLILSSDDGLLAVIGLFLLIFLVLFIPISRYVRPLIEVDAIRYYLEGMEKKLRAWDFCRDDLTDLQRLRNILSTKERKIYLLYLFRTSFILSEMEKREEAKTQFYWGDNRCEFRH